MNNQIKVGFLVSYDYMYLKHSLPIVYKDADFIALAIDNDRCTWSGKPYSLPDSFFEWITDFDKEKKIHIYEDDFHRPELSAIENDTRERFLLGQFMGEGGWHVQVDSDEYYADFSGFCSFLKSLDITKPTQVLAQFVTMYKQDEKGTYIVESREEFPAATNNPNYSRCRYSSGNIVTIFMPFKVLHQSWGRSADEISQKLNNWGHQDDFDTKEYFRLWEFVNSFNYRYINDFHPIVPTMWQALEYINTKNIGELLTILRKRDEEALLNPRPSRFSKADFVPPIITRALRAAKRRLK